MAKKLHYFNSNGVAEFIRYLLHYNRQEFEDIQYELSSWPDEKVKAFLPYGQLPVYEEGDRILNQSVAIARYVARKAGLVPEDAWEQAVLDATVDNIFEFRHKMFRCIVEQDPEKQKARRKRIEDEYIDYYFSRYESQIQKGNGYLGGKLTWADFALAGLVDMAHLFFDIEVEKNYPGVKALVSKVWSLPGVKEYRASKKPYLKEHDLTGFVKAHGD